MCACGHDIKGFTCAVTNNVVGGVGEVNCVFTNKTNHI